MMLAPWDTIVGLPEDLLHGAAAIFGGSDYTVCFTGCRADELPFTECHKECCGPLREPCLPQATAP